MSSSGNNGRKSGSSGGGWFSGVSSFFGFGGSSSPRPTPTVTPPPQPAKRNDQWAGPNATPSQVRQAQMNRWLIGKGDHPDVIAKRAQKASQPPPTPKPYSGVDWSFPGFGYQFGLPNGGSVDKRVLTAQVQAKATPKSVDVNVGANLSETTYTHPSGTKVGTSLGVGGGFGIAEDGPDKTRLSVSAGRFSASHSFQNSDLQKFLDAQNGFDDPFSGP